LRAELLLAHSIVEAVTHGLVLSQRAPGEVGLVHLYGVHITLASSHAHHGRASSAVVGSSPSIRHARDEGLALEAHASLGAWEVHGDGVDLVVDHVVDAHLALAATLLRGHWEVI